MKLNLSAAIMWLCAWGVIATTVVWCFYKMLTEKKK